MKMIRKLAARVILALILLMATGLSKLSKSIRRPKPHESANVGTLVILGTFHNVGWFRAHAEPLSQCGCFDEIVIVTDQPQEDCPGNVRFVCPPRAMVAILGRALSRFLLLILTGFRESPTVYMGYHIVPNAIFCLVGAALFGGKACYQMTGGPIELIGGGVSSENPLLMALGSESELIQRLLYQAVGCFDLVVVRGKKAKKFLTERAISDRVVVITGAIDLERFGYADQPRDIDIVYAGRVVPNKGLKRLLRVMTVLDRHGRKYHLGIVGDGELLEVLKEETKQAGLEDAVSFYGQVSDVREFLNRAKCFVLLSRSEGVSIAMLEAMASGVPVLVSDVGELRDIVSQAPGSQFIDGESDLEIADMIVELVDDEKAWSEKSCAARRVIVERFSIQAVTNRWVEVFGGRKA